MARIPAYCRHRASGKAYVTLRDFSGNRRVVYLGDYDTPESRQEYARVIAELAANPTPTATAAAGKRLTVNEVLLGFWEHVDSYYPPDSKHRFNVKQAMKPVRELYGHTSAAEFGPVALKTVREKYVGRGLSRYSVNRATTTIKRAFKWAASEQLLPVTVYQALATVEGIRKGRTTLRESKKVPPVPVGDVLATLPHLPAPVAAMVMIQRFSGMRPQEVCRLRPCEVDTSVQPWLYVPTHHKMEHAGKDREIYFGPKAQEYLKDYITGDPEAYCFTPAKIVAASIAERAAKRKTPRYGKSAQKTVRRKKHRHIAYPVASYRQCIERACERAKRHGTPVAVWKPNQLRHLRGTEIRDEYGIDAAQAVLGHSKANTTEIYAAVSRQKAREVAMKSG